MTFVNLTVQGSHRRYIPWTVIEILSGKTFSGLFEEILAGDHPRLIVNKELTRCTFEYCLCWSKQRFSQCCR